MDMHEVSALAGKQRVFRARQKICSAGYISHITQRAAGREPLFLEDGDYLTMLGLLKNTAEEHDVKFYALAFMPNHIHLLLEPRKDNLSQAMHSIFFRYARRFNHKYERRGHIFGGPYRQAVCLDNTYLLAASIYIHLNPVRAGLIKQAQEYRWSSCSLYTRFDPPSSFVDPGPVLTLLVQDQEQARNYYAKLLQGAGSQSPGNALEQEGVIEKLLNVLVRLFPGLLKKVARKDQAAQKSGQQLPELPELDDLLHKVLSGKPRSPETIKARRYLVEQLVARGYKKTEIAERLQLNRKTVYNILRRQDQL